MSAERHRAGCMACGAPLLYDHGRGERACHYCGAAVESEVCCEQGHFVCDRCHAGDGAAVIEQICLRSGETDMLALMQQIRRHPAIAMHGPEHHGMVPAVILTTYRNLGGAGVDDEAIRAVIQRGLRVPGGYCGYAGTCGAATGVGVAFARLLGSSPVKADERGTVLGVTATVLSELAALGAARCCQRDAWVALRRAAGLSASLLPVELQARADWRCEQWPLNRQCLGERCPLRAPAPGGPPPDLR